MIILPLTSITTAVSAQLSQTLDFRGQSMPLNISAFAIFNYGSGGTTAKAWLQTSFDGGTTWFDVMSFAFTTSALTKFANVARATAVVPVGPTDGALADNTKNDGFVGPMWRVKYTTTGTYGGTTNLTVYLFGAP